MSSIQSSKPHAIIVVGIPGSGKSTFASAFAETFQAPYIDEEKIQQHAASDEGAIALIDTFLGELARTKRTFLYEPVSGTRISRVDFGRWARANGYDPLIVWVQVDAKTAEARARKNGHSSEDFAARSRQFSAPHEREKVVVVSGKHTPASQTKIVLGRLSAPESSRPLVTLRRPTSDITRSR